MGGHSKAQFEFANFMLLQLISNEPLGYRRFQSGRILDMATQLARQDCLPWNFAFSLKTIISDQGERNVM
jgi:hypothetical protein